MIALSQVVPREPESRKGSFGHTIENGVLRYVSVSQVTTFEPSQEGGCPRKWAFERIEHRKPPSTTAQETGTALHAQIETHLKTGADSLGVIVRKGKHFIPEPKEGLLVEHELGDDLVLRPVVQDETAKQTSPSARVVGLFDTWRGMTARGADALQAQRWYQENLSSALAADGTSIPFIGYIDVVNTRGFWIDNDGSTQLMPANGIEVIDWKTSSNIAKWAKSASSLVDTVQLAVYAEYISRRYPGTTQVRLSHGYFQTKGLKAEKRSVLVPVDVIRQRWQRVSQTVRTMADVGKETDASKVEPNYQSCAVFGGCPHRHLCPRSPEQILVDLFGGKKAMGLMDKFGAAGAAPAASLLSPPVTTSAAPATAASSAAFVDAIHNKFGAGAATTAAAAAVVPVVSTPVASAPLTNGHTNGHTSGHTNGTALVAAPGSAIATPAAAVQVAAPAAVACCSEPVTPANTATVGSDTWHMVTSPPHKLMRGAAPRANVPFRNGMRIRNQEGAQIAISQDLATGLWFSQTVTADGSLLPPSPTRPEIWFTDVWTEVAVTTVTTVTTTATPAPLNAVAPPDAPASHPALNALAVPPGTALFGEIATAVAAHDQEAKAAEPPKTVGRPKGSKNKKAEEAASVHPNQLPMFATSVQAPSAPTTPAVGALVLFVDCPTIRLPGIAVQDLEFWVADLCATLAAAAGLDDIRVGADDNALAFGKWKGALAAAVRATPPSGMCSLEVGTDEIKQVVATTLKPLATGGYVCGSK